MRIEALPEEERTPYWRNSYHSGRMVIVAERLLEKAQEAGLLPGRKVAAVISHHSGAGPTYRLSGTWPRFLAAVLDR